MTTPVPGFRGVLTLWYRGLVSANNPYLKPWKVRVRRVRAGWDGGCWYEAKAPIVLPGNIVAMNPVHIIYECATNALWGRGLDRALMDDAAFRTAADQAYAEGFGLCLRWTRQESLSAFVQRVVDHVGAVVYIDRRTGLFTIRLLRGDYDPATLPLYDFNSGLLEIVADDAGSPANAANEIIVKYHDPIMDEDRETRAQNLAALQETGAIISATLDYAGIPTQELAARVALRDLAVQATALKRFTIRLDRRGWGLPPGGVFRIRDLTRGIANMVLRIGKVEDAQNGAITYTCVQDVFGLPATGFVVSQPPVWIPPVTQPPPATRERITEASYRDAVRFLTAAELAALDANSGAIMVVAGRPVAGSAAYQLATKASGEEYVVRATAAWTPTGIAPALTAGQTTFVLTAGTDWPAVVVGGALRIGAEWMRVDAFDAVTGVITVARGTVDTVPEPHDPAFAFFSDVALSSDRREYVTGEVISAKVLTVLSSAVLDVSLAPVLTATIAARHFKPYPPGNVKVDGVPFYGLPTAAPGGDRIVTWAHRDRITELDALIGHTEGSIGPEAGTTYEIEVWRAGVLLRTVLGIAGETWTYTPLMQMADGVGRTARLTLASRRDGVASLQRYGFDVALVRTDGWGYGFGYSWGVRT